MIRDVFTEEKKIVVLKDALNKYIMDRCIPISLRNVKLVMIPKPDGTLRPISVTEPYKMVPDKIILELIEPLMPCMTIKPPSAEIDR